MAFQGYFIVEINKVWNGSNPDVVHFLTGDPTLVSYIKFRKNAKMYYTVHDLYSHEITQ